MIEKLLNDRLNKYKSNLSDFMKTKMDKYADQTEIDKLKSIIDELNYLKSRLL